MAFEQQKSPNQKLSAPRVSVFQDWAGGDATTLWAAATSGKGAIAVHLLACMLARLFSPAEATALWEELIASRKKQLAQVVEADPINLALMSAA
jgi:hypothetical protein